MRRWAFEQGLSLFFLAFFLLSLLGQSLSGVHLYNEVILAHGGWTQFNNDQTEHGEPVVTWLSYVVTSDFWNRTLQNWQSEFLAVGTMAVFTIYLRQRGSPESKPVGSAHETTGASG